MKALEKDERFKKRAPSFVRARFDTLNGSKRAKPPLFVTRNNSYFLFFDAKGREVRRVVDEAGESGWSGEFQKSNAHEEIRLAEVISAMDEVLEKRREGKAGFELFVRMLEDRRAGVRMDGLWYIGNLGPKAAPAVPALIDFLVAAPDTPKGKQASWAARVLGGIGPAARKALPHLMRVSLEGSQARGQASAEALSRIDPEGAAVLPTLIEVLEKHEIAGIGASLSIERLGEKAAAAVPALIGAIKRSENRAVQLYAVKALGAIGPKAKEAIPLLEKIAGREPPKTKNANWEVEGAAAAALARVRPAKK